MYIKDYWNNKENRAKDAKMHIEKMQKEYQSNIFQSKQMTKIYSPDFKYEHKQDGVVPKIVLSELDSVSAVYDFHNGKTALLNFSSHKNPGGMFLNGSKAQEECLCHESTLYNVLSGFETDFYEWNRKHLNKALYVNRGLYSPDIMFVKDNKELQCDVITCAAPNKSAAQKYQNVSDDVNTKELRSRIQFVLDMADENHVSTLILGAYGCGVFGQDPYEVASIFKEFLNSKNYHFKTVIFGIPKGKNDNFEAFEKVFC